MDKLYSFTYFSDGKKVFLKEPTAFKSSSDGNGYHFAEVYTDADLDDKIGMIGFSFTGTLSAVWGVSGEDSTSTIYDVMRLALPFIKLPISTEQFNSFKNSTYPCIQLYSGDVFTFHEHNGIISLPAASSPQAFFKEKIFNGKFGDNEVKQLVLIHGYLEAFSDPMGDFRFETINLGSALWMVKPIKIARAFNSLVDGGLLIELGKKSTSGYPTFSKITGDARASVESVSVKKEPAEDVANSQIESNILTENYISKDVISEILKAAEHAGYNTSKLENMISELNKSYMDRQSQSCHALIRSMLDHIAPLFGLRNFDQVANNFTWSRSDRDRVKELQTIFRFDADESMHSVISKKNTAVDMHTIGVIRTTINRVLSEAANAVSSAAQKPH